MLLKVGLLEKSIGSGSSGLADSDTDADVDADDVLTLEPTLPKVVMSVDLESLRKTESFLLKYFSSNFQIEALISPKNI